MLPVKVPEAQDKQPYGVIASSIKDGKLPVFAAHSQYMHREMA